MAFDGFSPEFRTFVEGLGHDGLCHNHWTCVDIEKIARAWAKHERIMPHAKREPCIVEGEPQEPRKAEEPQAVHVCEMVGLETCVGLILDRLRRLDRGQEMLKVHVEALLEKEKATL